MSVREHADRPFASPEGRPQRGCQTGDVNAQPDRTASYALAPLRWVAEEDLLYEPRSRTLHRPSCHVAREHLLVRSVPAGSAVELVWAPRMCECGPDVTVALGYH
jgi:hypothetical protein